MSVNRREFLGIAGVTLLGIGKTSVFELLRPGELEAQTSSNNAPLTAKRWSMIVDMSKFKSQEDYQMCIDACNRVHSIPVFNNTKHEVKWIWTETFEDVFPDHANQYMEDSIKGKPSLVLCNHCDNPPCVRVCPTQATFKRNDGIVMMDYHRCIGCRLCMAACFYGARSFNWVDPREYVREFNPAFPTRTKGVVEKCNFCQERLYKGLLPACVEMSRGAMVFGDLADPDSEVRKILRESYAIRRKPAFGANPSVFYLIGGNGNV